MSSPAARHRRPSRLPAAQSRPSAPAARAGHRKPQRAVSEPVQPAAAARHRKPSALQGKPAKATAVTALAVSAAAASAAATKWSAGTSGHPAAARASAMSAPSAKLGAADGRQGAGAGPAGPSAVAAADQQPALIYHPRIRPNSPQPPRPKGRHHRPAAAVASPPASSPPRVSSNPYSNPLRAVTGLIPERVDMGVDFGGSGPVYPLGDAVITNATGSSSGWPGGGWITYRLTDGPDAGLMVYVAEDVRPTVAAGEVVTPSTVIATVYDGGTGIETGWAMPDGASAESQLPQAGGIGGSGPFPTMVGLSFENLLRSLGAPAAPNADGSGYGALPPGYPAA